MTGRAEFAKAEQNRKIKIEGAKANLEAEKLNAQNSLIYIPTEGNLPILEAGRSKSN